MLKMFFKEQIRLLSVDTSARFPQCSVHTSGLHRTAPTLLHPRSSLGAGQEAGQGVGQGIYLNT